MCWICVCFSVLFEHICVVFKTNELVSEPKNVCQEKKVMMTADRMVMMTKRWWKHLMHIWAQAEQRTQKHSQLKTHPHALQVSVNDLKHLILN